MFIVSLTYTVELNQVEEHLSAHIEYLDRQYAAGIFLASGRKVPRTGGIILAIANSKNELEEILTEDPFKVHSLAHYEIIEFLPTKVTKELSFLQNQ